MIVIVSSRYDTSTNDVIDWLKYYDANFIRVQTETAIKINRLNINSKNIDFELEYQERIIDSKKLTGYWYRRGRLNLGWQPTHSGIGTIQKYIKEEQTNVEEFIDVTLSNFGVGCYSDNYLNKLFVLSKAIEFGFTIPLSLVSSKKSEYLRYANTLESLITKPLNQKSLMFETGELVLDTNELHSEDLKNIEAECVPFLAQSKIEKIAEVRVFYWLGKCYSCIIHSQKDKGTSVDMRLDSLSGKNSRWEPFELSENIAGRVKLLMNSVRLKSGSLDFAIDQNGGYVFFEVNPVGQFGYLSALGGYNIEKIIANDLITGRARKFNFSE